MPRGKLYFREFSKTMFVPDGAAALPRRQDLVLEGVDAVDTGDAIVLTPPPGPAGPAGPQGAQGAQGVQGPAGAGSYDPATASANGLLTSTDYVVLRDNVPRVFHARSGAYGIVADGVTNTRVALSTLANTTMQPNGGTIVFGPGVYYTDTMTYPANVTLDFSQSSGVLRPAASSDVRILGNIVAGQRQRIFDTATHNTSVVRTNVPVRPEWWGAASDGATDCYHGLIRAMQAQPTVSDGGSDGGLLELLGTRGDYVTSSLVVMSGDSASHKTIRGAGRKTRIKHTVDTVSAEPDGIITLDGNGTAGGMKKILVEDITVSGNSAEDRSKGIRVGSAKEAMFRNVRIENTALEGIYTNSPSNCDGLTIAFCEAENVGRQVGQPLSAFNTNAQRTIVIGSKQKSVGRFVEHTGRDFVFLGNLFRDADTAGMQLCSSSWNHELGVAAANVIAHAPAGLFVADGAQTCGKLVFGHNVIYDCASGIDVSSVGGNVCLVDGNVIVGGDPNGFALRSGNGANVLQNTVVSKVSGTTTGTILTGALSTLRLPLGTGITEGCYVEIAGVTGAKRVTATTFTVTGGGLVTATLDTPADATVASAAVTYYSRDWASICRLDVDDYQTIEGLKVIGIPWATTAFRMFGIKATIKGCTFQPRGLAYPNIAVLQIIDASSSEAGRLATVDFAVSSPWCYSSTEPSFIHASSTPPSMTWKVGDYTINPSPVAGGYRGKVCVTAGTLHSGSTTVNGGATTATIAASGDRSATLTSLVGIYVGCKIQIGTVTGYRTVASIAGSVITWPTSEATAGVTGSGLSVAYSAPVWKDYGGIAA